MGPYLLVSVLGGVVRAMLASGKQRNVPMWFVIGFLLPLISIVILLVMPGQTTATHVASPSMPSAAKRSSPLESQGSTRYASLEMTKTCDVLRPRRTAALHRAGGTRVEERWRNDGERGS